MDIADPVINIWEGIKRVRLNRVGGCFVGRGSCLFEDKKIYVLAPSVRARSKFAIALSRINFPELLL